MNKTALITGAARRIGREIAISLAQDGYDIVIHFSKSEKEANSLQKQLGKLGVRAVCLRANLLQDREIEVLIDRAREKINKDLSVLVNNASIFEKDSMLTMSMDSWDRHIFSNFKAPVFLSQSFAKQVPESQTDINGEIISSANIINVVDQKVLNSNPKFMTYTLAKLGLWNFTKLAAQALGPRIRVNAIGPGPVLKAHFETEVSFQKKRKGTLLQRGSDVHEICRAIRFILSSPGLTGQMLSIDGGEHLNWQPTN